MVYYDDFIKALSIGNFDDFTEEDIVKYINLNKSVVTADSFVHLVKYSLKHIWVNLFKYLIRLNIDFGYDILFYGGMLKDLTRDIFIETLVFMKSFSPHIFKKSINISDMYILAIMEEQLVVLDFLTSCNFVPVTRKIYNSGYLSEHDGKVLLNHCFELLSKQCIYEHSVRKVCKILIENNIDLDKKDESDITPIMAAAAYGFTEYVRMLLSKNVNINVVNRLGDTALMLAIKNNHIDTTRLLLKDSDLRVVDKQGFSIYQLLTFRNYYDLAKIIYFLEN